MLGYLLIVKSQKDPSMGQEEEMNPTQVSALHPIVKQNPRGMSTNTLSLFSVGSLNC